MPHQQKSGVTILKEIRDCTRGPFNPSSVRRPKKGQTGINSHFTKIALALSQGTEWNSSTHTIQARSHQMPVTVSAVLDLNQNTDLRMKGFISYYQFSRYLILTPTDSLPSLLLNLWRDSPQLLPMGICFAVKCSWKPSSCFRLSFSHLTYFHTIFESQATHLICSVPLQDLTTDHKDLTTDHTLSSLSQLSIWFHGFFSCSNSRHLPSISSSPKCWREPFSQYDEARIQKCFFPPCFEMIRMIFWYYRLQGSNEVVTVASATGNAGSRYSL